MNEHDIYMQKCFSLAAQGLGKTRSNPLVGAVIVKDGEIIGEGAHLCFGEAHAEVNAVKSVQNQDDLKNATIYVSLEPCSHTGKTPPCADLIIEKGFQKLVFSNLDPNPLVAGKGIEKIKNAGIEVEQYGAEQGAEINRRFFTFQEKKRPFIVLKWAQTADGFIDISREEGDDLTPLKITSQTVDKISHQWRAEEMGIMVGTQTALLDNPSLTVRHAKGEQPLRILLDRNLEVPAYFNLIDNSTPTVVVTDSPIHPMKKVDYIGIENGDSLQTVFNYCVQKNVISILVEGGQKLLQSFIDQNLWDEMRIITNKNISIEKGKKAPHFDINTTEVIDKWQPTAEEEIQIIRPKR